MANVDVHEDESKPETDAEQGRSTTDGPVAADPGSTGAESTGAESTEPSAARRRPNRRVLLVAGLSVLLVVLLAVGTLLFFRHRETNQELVRSQQALAVAQQVATDLTSLGATDAQARISSLTQDATGEFKNEISKYATVVQSVLAQSKAGSTGTVSAAGIEKIDANTASALATVTAEVTNDKQPQAQQLAYRLSIQLQREGDRWLVSGVTFVQ